MKYLNPLQARAFEEKQRSSDSTLPDIWMISGCEDRQTSADVSNIAAVNHTLPDSRGRPGGACTSALLKVLYEEEEHNPFSKSPFIDILSKVRLVLREKGFTQIPQLSSTREIDLQRTPFDLAPENVITGEKRAVLIGINYIGQGKGELSGCHNDVFHMYNYIQEYYGFQDPDIEVLVDDGDHKTPTKANILVAYQKVVQRSRPGDAVFLHYSGHGTKVRDLNGDEDDGYDEALVPLDFKTAGVILDDELYHIFVNGLTSGVHVVAIFDCCHSGTVLDLPYVFQADGSVSSSTARMQIPTKFSDTKNLFKLLKDGRKFMKKGKHISNMLGQAGKAGGFMKTFLK